MSEPPAGEKRVDSSAETLDSVNPRRRASDFVECPSCGRANGTDARFCAGCGHHFGGDDEPSDDRDEGVADPLLGRVIAERYRIEELLGRGGMGVVYRVEHVRIGKLMAMKLLHGKLARDREVVKRFKREAEAVSRLDHPNTVQVFDFGQSEGMTYLVMEYLAGKDLGQAIKEKGAIEFVRVARMAAQICGSVAQAHHLGIIHRDLKPENIMLLEDRTEEDYVKVLDFGLAKLREDQESGEKSITRAGSILGTPYYMAPEHIRGDVVDERSDVYALGALLYKAVTGVPPFWAATPVGVLTKHLTEDLTPPSVRAPKRDIPEEADRIIAHAMERDPNDRYASMDDLRADLLSYLEGIGAASGLSSRKLRGVRRGEVESASGRQRKVATRGDVDDFERRIRRRSLMSYGLAVLLVAVLVAGGVYVFLSRPVAISDREGEPNDELINANRLPEQATIRGYLGQRGSDDRSDADFYRIENPRGERRTVRIEVSAIPNIDIVFELFGEGITTPLLTADSGGIGEPETVPNFVVDGATYYIRVRELWQSGRLPTENVSDAYTVRFRFVDLEEDVETEVNDSVELPDEIAAGAVRRGYIGWGGDEDVYCLSENAPAFTASLEGVSTLDLSLTVIDRVTGRVDVIDEHPLGEGERSPQIEEGSAGTKCFLVSARRPKEGLGNAPSEPYVLRLDLVEGG